MADKNAKEHIAESGEDRIPVSRRTDAPHRVDLFNTMTRRIEEFVPITPGRVRMYTCGPTVYDYAHIGNLRTYVSEDLLEKTLRAAGYHVRRVMNITDVGHLESDADEGEDKMLKGAKRENKTVWEVARFYEEAFFADCARLRIDRPGETHRATEYIDRYIAFIRELERRGHAYFRGGNVYFDISTFPAYTVLNRVNIDEMRTASRDGVQVDESKKNPQDFVLWFTKSKFDNQAMKWDSPWGTGYPGWHIECSVIALDTLGEQLDIHCGGVDHIMTHHTNEIAQTESYTGRKWVNYWWHGEFLCDVTGKMSKSKGEFLTLQLLIDRGYHPLAYRYYLLGSHYRRQLDFSFENLDMAQSGYFKLRRRITEMMAGGGAGAASAARAGEIEPARGTADTPGAAAEACSGDYTADPSYRAVSETAKAHVDAFFRCLFDDLGSANALSALYALLRSELPDGDKLGAIRVMDRVLSLDLTVPFVEGARVDESEAEQIQQLVDERLRAKAQKDWQKADEIRNRLAEMGVSLKDVPGGTEWSKR